MIEMRKLFFLFLNIMIFTGIVANEHERDRKRHPKIIGGGSAPEGVFNYMVALYFQKTFICSASIISDRLVLTAAHCVIHGNVSQKAEDFVGHAGNVNRSSPTYKLEFKSLRIHPDYNPKDLSADIAIMVTKEKIDFDEWSKVKRLCLYEEVKEKSREFLALGWGSTSAQFGRFTENLQFMFLTVVKNTICSVIQRTITNSTLCARGFNRGICQGDSGGPIIDFNASGIPYQVAIASYINSKFGCGTLSLYARIYSYKDFIFDAEKEFETSVCFSS